METIVLFALQEMRLITANDTRVKRDIKDWQSCLYYSLAKDCFAAFPFSFFVALSEITPKNEKIRLYNPFCLTTYFLQK